MTKPNIHTLTGDGAFGLVHELCITPLLKETAGEVIGLEEHDWSLHNRVRTDGKVILDSLKIIIGEGAAAIKYPGATATAEELAYAMQVTNSSEPKTALGKGKSPNAVVRGASGLDASIVRPPAKSAALIQPLVTQWSAKIPVEIHTLESGGRKANAEVSYVSQSSKVAVSFTGDDGIEQPLYGASGSDFMLTKDSPVSVTHVDMDKVVARIRATFDEALSRNADITLATKNTVLTSVDAPIVKKAQEIFDTEYREKFVEKGMKFQAGLVDDAFAYLLANEWNHGKPLIMLCPDDCYGAQMKQVLAAVKEHGLHYDHTRHPIAVARLSNGYGDEYGGIHLTPKTDGKLTIYLPGNTKIVDVKHNSMWLIASHDVGAAKTYASRMIDYALHNTIGGRKAEKLYFGFDVHSAAEAPLAAAIDGVIKARKADLDAGGIHAELRHPAQIAAEVLTSPSKQGTILALNNLWGDIMADLFPALANNKASFDSLLISDKAFMVETGAGGTAGDLLAGKPGEKNAGMLHHGKMPLNPIAILSGYAHAIRYKGNEAQIRYAEGLEEAIDRSLKQGYLTGDLVKRGEPQLIEEFLQPGKTPHAVDTRVFVQAVKANLLELQGKKAEAEMARKVLALLEQKHDFADPALPTAEEHRVIRKYLTSAAGSLNQNAA